MPERSLKFLSELNTERFEELSSDVQQSLFPREQSFLDLADTLASHEKIQPKLLRLIVDDNLNEDSLSMALYLLLLGDNKEEQKEALEILLYKKKNTVILSAFSLLGGDHAQPVLDILLALKLESSLSIAAQYLLQNKIDKSFIKYFVDEKNQPLFKDIYVLKYLALSGADKITQYLLEKLQDTEDSDSKLKFAKALLLAKNEDALAWLGSPEGMVADKCRYFQAIASELDTDKLASFLEEHVADDSVLLEAANNLYFYGNPESMSSFFEVIIGSKSMKVQKEYHRLMLSFFDEDEEEIFEGIVLLEASSFSEKEYKSKIESFWQLKSVFVNNYLKEQKYFGFLSFSVSEVVEYFLNPIRDDEFTLGFSLDQIIDFVFIWTGEYIYIDSQALLSKQKQQLEVALDSIQKMNFESGKWLRWGEEVISAISPYVPKTLVTNNDNNQSTFSPVINRLTHAYETGQYYASLPEGHPEEEKLMLDSFAYQKYKKGEPFGYYYLCDYDVDNITWKLKEK